MPRASAVAVGDEPVRRRTHGRGLHDVIGHVLGEAQEPLTAAEIARRINDARLFVGFLARRFAGSFKKQLHRSLESGLAYLRGAAEGTR